ncbi:glycosyltransferase family 4 protein [bacterium]|nr:glycosyltransferase family 4 protein [bacterium]
MRIAHVLFSGLGGVYNVVNSLIKDNEKNCAGIYVGSNLSKDCLSHKKILKNNFFFVKTIRFLSFFFFPVIAIHLIKFRPDIIVLHNYQILGCIITKLFFNTKIIYVDHTPLNIKNFKDRMIIKIFDTFIDKFVVLNNENLIFLNKELGISKRKIAKIYNGISVVYKKKIKRSKKDSLIVGMSGRLNDKKHFDILINAVQSILNKNIKIKCLIAGTGESKDKLKKLILKKNKKNIIFCGLLNQIQLMQWFTKLDLYIQASKGEAMSISILQAMFMEVPVMGSNVNGIKNLKYPSKKNSMIFSNQVNDLEKKIIKFIKLKKKLKKNIVKKQLRYVSDNFTEELMISKYNEIYNTLFR